MSLTAIQSQGETLQRHSPSATVSTAFKIVYADHRFSPAKLEIPAGRAVKIMVVNASAERIEFESFKLHRERIVEPSQSAVVSLPAVKPGTYDFFDDFHDQVPEGVIAAR